MDVIDSNFRFGFVTPPSLLSGTAESWQSLPTEVGRFEVLRIEKDSDGTTNV